MDDRGIRGSNIGRGNIFIFWGGGLHLDRQWLPGAVYLGIKRLGYEADHSPPPKLRIHGAIPPFIHSYLWNGAYLSTAIIL